MSSHSSLTPVLALSKRNSNAAEIILYLHKLVAVLTEYFKEVEEESIRDNFVIIYELLDEMMDFGHPQTTESKILQVCQALTLPPSSTSADTRNTSRKNRTSSRYRSARRWPSPTPCRGVPRESGTGKTRCSWTLWRASTCW